MRNWLMMGCALIALQSAPARGLTTPDPLRPEDAGGDTRVRQAYWQPGKVIKVVGSQGQSLVVEMPKGMKTSELMLSEQSVMTPERFPDDCEETVDSTTGEVVRKCKPQTVPENKEEGCTRTLDLKLCVRRDRFLFFIPFVELDEQSLLMIFIETRKVGKKTEEIEHSVIFQVSTVAKDERPYYGVKVVVGEAPKPSVSRETPAVAAPPFPAERVIEPPPYRPAVTIPKRPGMPAQDRQLMRDLERARAPAPVAQPPARNEKYFIYGDQNLIGR